MTNNMNQELFEEQLTALRKEYADQLPGKIREIEAIWDKLVQAEWDDEAFEIMHRMTHGLAGSGASFGFLTLSDAARTLERLATTIIEDGVPPTAEQRKQIRALLDALKPASLRPDESVPKVTRIAHRPSKHSPLHEKDNRLVFLVEDDPHLAQDLALQIGHFGYEVKTYRQTTGLKEAVNQTPPAAIIMDIMFPEGFLAGTEVIADIQHGRENPIPVIFISARGDLTARLHAVHASGEAYFTKPVDIGRLIDRLDILTARQNSEPYRILIVEDEVMLAAHYELILQQAGMATTVITDPMHVMRPLVDFRPDLILMDIYMPNYDDGKELAKAIRQQDAYISIPIVFLSNETSIESQLEAMHFGVDDFLAKPIEAEHLVSSIEHRVERARILRSFMDRDSLTGLLNHTKIKEQLDIEASRAKRENSTLSYAMIDIDYFKSVNDTYGHSIGDRILKNLSRLLRQRFRKTDSIGRYGGEEFAILLPDTDGPTAVKIIDEIRAAFAQIRHQFDDAEFYVTFSCGVASLPPYETANQLSEEADKALYEAKSAGRNRVVLAD